MGELERIVEGAKEGGVTSNGQSEHEIVLINLHNNAMKVQERLHATLAHWQVKKLSFHSTYFGKNFQIEHSIDMLKIYKILGTV
jgi:hypothetical protein